jgi:hypothetical protein
MTYVSARFAQADPGIVSGSTIERKKMSTKTSFKRIALVAVAALGAGVLSVAPANAADAYTSAATTATHYATVGTAITTTVTIAGDAGSVLTGGTVTATMTAAPTGSTAAASWSSTGIEAPFAAGGTANDTHPTTYATNVATIAADPDGTGVGLTTAKIMGTLSFTPAVAGTYTITLTLDSAFGAGTETNGTITVYAAGLAYALGDGAAVTPATSGNGIAGPANTVTVNATANASNTRSLITVSGAGATINSNDGSALAAGVTSTVLASGGTSKAIVINTPTAGTVTVSQFYESGNGTGIYAATASKTVTITVGTAAVNGTLAAGNSTSIIDGTIGADNEAWSSITADETAIASANATTPSDNPTLEVAVIKVVLNDSLKNLMPNGTPVAASITGPGLLALGATQQNSAVGRSLTTVTAGGTGAAFVSVYRDGTAGVATITITSGTTVIGTETVTFYGVPAKYTATTQLNVKADGSTVGDAVVVCAVDAANVVVPGAEIYAYSGDTTVATVATSATTGSSAVTTATAAAGANNYVALKGIGCAGFSMVGLSQTTKSSVVVTFGNASTLATSTVTTTATVNAGSVAATTVTLALNKTSYAPGEEMTATLTFRDAQGRLVGAGPGTGALATTGLVPSQSMVNSPFFGTTGDVATALGTATSKLFAPLSAGPVTITGKTGAGDTGTYLVTAAQGITLTAAATVVAPASVDSANIAALTTLVNSLIAKINALNKLVIKIQKKVRA